ncbi:D-glycero-beta-D-manno-heptose-7-phosphate kinase [Roseospira marina]|uniref:Bifunctional protein HldE n=1 Tax=Roseospira marina TaxID=140057 RepID=A0A5M6I370_9PROT|nr:D-glycero-beta-D-manno-heptose-7-phosphate kinase [Roseospira marina]KAA5602622.1 D-glycero-beta-D-manno-heptose-7-phosphate kinase [Roseospira marina]MBB4316261.1 D-beta-D-heptose 7-phosphate kinase/D-beta-D-heptose 1-phosphate adenosyltransferase [Roseospira marina]MBB5089458.1 D-beta-D-heptose 7-phosphate kinase/D-beta-D-heptose 1-phosphate adenosyltransferase [Roseospira marina]
MPAPIPADAAALADWIDRLSDARVLCVGDVMLDRFVHGDVDRVSPEAPIPVLRIRRESVMLGGAGNVARNLVGLGCGVVFLSGAGDDAAGAEVAQLLDQLAGVEVHLATEPGRPTTLKTRFVAGGQQLLRADAETTQPIADATAARLLTAARTALATCGAMILSDYGKSILTDTVTRALIDAATAAGVPVIVDPKGHDYRRYAGATVVTPNRKELSEATGGRATDDDASVEAAARALLDTCGLSAVLATRSQDGMSLVPADGPADHLPTEAREVYDVSGAGDTVVATLAAALAAGAPLSIGARLSNVAAGLVVAKVGTAAIAAADLNTALHHQDLARAEDKVQRLERLTETVERWRRHGLRVGFTNGCFDLLHPGHVSLLAQARAACDRLVVGLNSDASVRRLKGPTRPVQGETARATVLASLADVDRVVIFGEDTPLRLINALKPDVLVKGADYTLDTVVGADVVQAYGGRVLLARLEDGHSTTATLARVSASPDGTDPVVPR